MKYYLDKDMVDTEIAISGNSALMFDIRIEHISGKEVQDK